LLGPTAESAADRPTTLVYPPWKHNLGFNRLRQFHVTAYGGPGHKVDSPRGIAAVKLRQNDAAGPQDDDEVTVLGVNAGAREIIYNPSLVELAFFGDEQMGANGFNDPVGIAADPDGLVAVGDRGNDRVVLLRFDEHTRLHFDRSITLAETSRPLSRPAGVAIAEGVIYVADSGNDRVVAVDTAGGVVAEYNESSTPLEAPFGVAVIDGDVANRYYERFIAVTDRGGQRLSRLSLVGAPPRAVSYGAATGGSGGFDYVAIDYDADVFVTDGATGCVYKFDRALELLARFECDGDETDDLDSPRGITIHRRLGQVFIAEATGVSYYWIGTDVTGLRAAWTRPANGPGPLELEVQFLLTERSLVTVDLETDTGAAVIPLARKVPMRAGQARRTYRVERSNLPCGVAECTYRVTVRARATYSSAKYLEAVKSAPVHE
jgi:hypothetical protein